MKVLFAGGGTGGHLYPAVAMAGELKKLVADAEISFAGTSGGIESTEVPRLGFKLHLIPVRGLKRGWSLADIIANVGVLADFAAALGRAVALIGRESPDVVVGTGGFVSAPLLFAAQLLRKKTLIQEQNAFPGLTTKLLSSLASEVHLSFEDARRFIVKKQNLFVSGNPARLFEKQDSSAARGCFNLFTETGILNHNSCSALDKCLCIVTLMISGGIRIRHKHRCFTKIGQFCNS